MRRALGLAARAIGCTSPNPMVGSLVVRDDIVVGEGWHRAAGGSHAEVEALRDAGDASHGATLYATLEPCGHHGRTPPCVDAILAAGVRKVVYASADPNPAAAGGGEALRRAGVSVIQGIEKVAARELNRFFFHYISTGRPRVVAKCATSLDGRVATRIGESRWITGSASRRRGHELRQAVDAILVGAGTVIADDPVLTVRLDSAALAEDDVRHPRPIVLDSRGRVPLTSKLLSGEHRRRTLVATTSAMPLDHRESLIAAGNEVVVIDSTPGREQVSPRALLDELGHRGMQSVLIEGGPEVHGAFLDAGAIDEMWYFVAPMLIGGHEAKSSIGGNGIAHLSDAVRLESPLVERLDDDFLIRGDVSRVAAALVESEENV